jgi:hypothetical protein
VLRERGTHVLERAGLVDRKRGNVIKEAKK